MEIYYLKKEEFLNSIDINSLKKFIITAHQKNSLHLIWPMLSKEMVRLRWGQASI